MLRMTSQGECYLPEYYISAQLVQIGKLHTEEKGPQFALGPLFLQSTITWIGQTCWSIRQSPQVSQACNQKAGRPEVQLNLETGVLPKKADGSNDKPLLPTLHWLHQFWHQPSLQYIALDPVYTHTQVIQLEHVLGVIAFCKFLFYLHPLAGDIA